jgi:hypothetical protein
VYKIGFSELVKFRDAIIEFYEDFALLVRLGFPFPLVDDLNHGVLHFHGDFGCQIVAIIEPDGILLQTDSVPPFKKVSSRFKEIFKTERGLLRRAVQLMLGMANLELTFIASVCEALAELQKEPWASTIDWDQFFTDAAVIADGTGVTLTVSTAADSLDLEFSPVGHKIQIIASARSGHRTFSVHRGFAQWLSESTPHKHWVL